MYGPDNINEWRIIVTFKSFYARRHLHILRSIQWWVWELRVMGVMNILRYLQQQLDDMKISVLASGTVNSTVGFQPTFITEWSAKFHFNVSENK